MKRVDLAVRMFNDGYSCAQSMLGAFGPDLGLDRDQALKLAGPFWAGLSCTGGLCGAASGAILVLGLARGNTHPDDQVGRKQMTALTQEFLRRYGERQGSTLCTDILGYDLTRPGMLERVRAEGLSKPVCPDAIRAAGEILLELLREDPAGS